MTDPLENYRQLVARIDAFSAQVFGAWGEHLACRPGCAECCRELSLLPVEAAVLGAAFRELPGPVRDRVRRRLRAGAPGCPLLEEACCLLYRNRPVICRTHGLPLRVEEAGGSRIDFCPRNFQGVSSLPGSAILDLENLNRALAAVDGLYAGNHRPELKGRRLSLDEILLEAP